MGKMMKRRDFLTTAAAIAGVPHVLFADEVQARFSNVGIILYPWDLPGVNWPARAAEAGIDTIAFHAARRLDVLATFAQSDEGQAFVAQCRQLGIQVEYELHAFADLLSRELYYKDPNLFRVDGSGRRNPDFNCCPSSRQALEILGEKAVEYGRVMRPTSSRYFYWPDDGSELAWCHCSKCKGLSASDQATIVENAILKSLRENLDPKATHCHLAYHHTLQAPEQVKPDPGVFLEFATIRRRHDRSIAERDVALEGHDWLPPTHGAYLELLDRNLEVFPKATAQVLEYWLDVSYFCRWTRPEKKLPWYPAVLQADGREYAKRSVGHVTSFALWINQDYVRQFGQPPLREYVQSLKMP